ncbi:MAG: hypothetical protein OXN81_13130, partial [Alphaproteobacteria bacterium]|nr:hypothetical protein [Alphaproteobacteria bacterium]
AVGFSKYTPVAYRDERGDDWNISRAGFVEFGPPVWAQRRILAAIGDGVMLGAGVGGTVFCLMLLGAAGRGRRGRPGTALEPVEYPPRHFPVARPAGRVTDWVRPGLRAKIALLVVSPAELERLLTLFGQRRRPGFIDLPEPDGAKPMETDGELLERTEAPGLPLAEMARSADVTVPANPAPTDPESRPDTTEAEEPAEGQPVVPERELGEQFF